MENLNSGKTISSSDATYEWNRRRSLVPTAWEETIRVVGAEESEAAGRALAHAFATDPLSQYLLDGDDMAGYSDEQRWKLHVDLMTYMVSAHCLKGMVTTIGPDYEGIALWMLPNNQEVDDWWTVLRSGTWRLYYQLSPEGRKRYFDEMLPLLQLSKEQVMGERNGQCYYLVFVGTKPSARGKGYAGKLIRHMTEKADAENCPMYLESSSPLNKGFYAKFGFGLKREVVFQRGREPVRVDIMTREPQPPKQKQKPQQKPQQPLPAQSHSQSQQQQQQQQASTHAPAIKFKSVASPAQMLVPAIGGSVRV